MAGSRIWLDVPFGEKNEAKALGAVGPGYAAVVCAAAGNRGAGAMGSAAGRPGPVAGRGPLVR